MNERFSIGEVARLFSISVSSLRYYSDIGLLPPAFVDPETGYRYYSTEQFELLNSIRYLQALGFSLADIRRFLEKREVSSFVEQLQAQQQATEQQLRHFQEIQQKIARRLEQITDALRTDPLEQIEERHFPERPAVFLRQDIEAGASLELPIRQLESQSALRAAVFLGKVGLSISRENLENARFERYQSIFLLVENEFPNPAACQSLPAGPFLCLRFRGIHRQSPEHYTRLIRHIAANGYIIRGDSVEITLIDSGMTANPEQHVTEIQIPIKRPLDSPVT